MRRSSVLAFAPLAALVAMAVGASALGGCDTGGLLVVNRPDAGPDAGVVVLGPGATDFVSGGNVAKSEKYRLVFTLGQATPNQGPATGQDDRLNGGLVGASEGK